MAAALSALSSLAAVSSQHVAAAGSVALQTEVVAVTVLAGLLLAVYLYINRCAGPAPAGCKQRGTAGSVPYTA